MAISKIENQNAIFHIKEQVYTAGKSGNINLGISTDDYVLIGSFVLTANEFSLTPFIYNGSYCVIARKADTYNPEPDVTIRIFSFYMDRNVFH